MDQETILDELLKKRDDEEEDRKNYGMPLFLGGLGQPMSPAGYAALMGGVRMDPSYLGAARPMPLSGAQYGSLDSLLPQGGPQGTPQGISQGRQDGKNTMNITYLSADGNQYNMSATFDPGDRSKVVDVMMKYLGDIAKSSGDGSGNYRSRPQPERSAKPSGAYSPKGRSGPYAIPGRSSYGGKAYAGKGRGVAKGYSGRSGGKGGGLGGK